MRERAIFTYSSAGLSLSLLCMALGPQQEQTQDFCTWQKEKKLYLRILKS